VWDRWGIEVYDLHKQGGSDWDGLYGGAPQPMEVYFYFIRAVCTEKVDEKGLPIPEEYVGNVTIIR
jgi:hypothetical protein